MTPITASQARALTRSMISVLSGVPLAQVLLADGYGPAPTGAAIAYRWASDAAIGFGALVELPTEPPTTAWADAREVTVLVQAYGSAAVEALGTLAPLLDSPDSRRLAFVAQGLAVRSVGPITDRTQMLHDAPEPRADLNIVVGYVRVPGYTPADLAESIALARAGDTFASWALLPDETPPPSDPE